MMARKVVYYSRSGYSKAVAEKISRHLNCEAIRVTDDGHWKGFLGFLRGGYFASTGKDVGITVHGKVDLDDALIVVAPLWAGKVVPAIRVFFQTYPKAKAHYVVTSNGLPLREREGFLSVTDLIRRLKNEDEVLATLFSTL